jgi:hypothetical protein
LHSAAPDAQIVTLAGFDKGFKYLSVSPFGGEATA